MTLKHRMVRLQFWNFRDSGVTQLARVVEYTDWALERGKTPPNEYDIWWWSSSDTGALGNVEHTLITIAPRSTLCQIGSTW